VGRGPCSPPMSLSYRWRPLSGFGQARSASEIRDTLVSATLISPECPRVMGVSGHPERKDRAPAAQQRHRKQISSPPSPQCRCRAGQLGKMHPGLVEVAIGPHLRR